MIPELLARLDVETDKGLQMAYASALGNLRAEEAVGPLLALLAVTENRGARLELALSLARIVGEEHPFIQLLRQVRADPGTALSQAVAAMRKRQERGASGADLERTLTECEERLARGDLAQGCRLLARSLQEMPRERLDEAGALILAECARQMAQTGAEPLDYVLLALHTLQSSRV
ncbi:MAG: hypothetical protein DCC57_22350 [Chloroflexi bacterium]|nr:MAG: hypothetical protein DCC57_22350 [Chloroflexota bacterium]